MSRYDLPAKNPFRESLCNYCHKEIDTFHLGLAHEICMSCNDEWSIYVYKDGMTPEDGHKKMADRQRQLVQTTSVK